MGLKDLHYRGNQEVEVVIQAGPAQLESVQHLQGYVSEVDMQLFTLCLPRYSLQGPVYASHGIAMHVIVTCMSFCACILYCTSYIMVT